MKTLFILKDRNMFERSSVMYLSSALKESGHSVKLVIVEREGLAGLNKIMKDYSPHIVGYSSMTGEHKKILEINNSLKENFNFLAVFGGPHATFFPDLIHEEGCDAICIGEGDIAFPEFCRRVENNEAYWESPNFYVKYKQNIFRNPLLPLVEDLDKIPFPDRELMYEADPELLDESKKIFFSARGCPYRCTYCFNNKYNGIYTGKGNIVRHRSPEDLINEICAVKEKYTVGVVWIADDTFLLKPKGWLETFSRLYKEKIMLPISCNVRANLVTEENISLLRDTGLDSVFMGIECGDEDIANGVLLRRLSNAELLNASKIIKKYGIKLVAQNLIGLPVSNSFAVDLKTLDLNIKIRPTWAQTSILYPYPGTPIEAYARKNGFLSGDMLFLETNKRSTMFKFSKREKIKIENLHKLFALFVQFPILRKITVFLVSLPLTPIYVGVFYLWYGYIFKFKLFPFRSIRKELFKYIKLWWRIIKKE